MRKILIFALLGLQGCASSLYQEIPGAELQRVKSSSILVKYYEAPALWMMTPKTFVGEGLMARWTESSDLPLGAALVREYAIPDPTELLVAETTKTFAVEGITIDTIDDHSLPLPVPKQTAYPRTHDYVLELSTPSWFANYLPFNWKTYAFAVQGAGRLIRTSDQAVVWKGYCAHGGYDDKRMELDVSEFEENDAQKVKDALAIGTEACARQLAEQLTPAT